MRKSWVVTLGGRPRTIDVDWDLIASGSGSVSADGKLVSSWGWGMKLPGLTRQLALDGHTLEVVRGWFDFQLRIDGQLVEVAPSAVGGGSAKRITTLIVLVVALAVVAMLATLLVLLASRGAAR